MSVKKSLFSGMALCTTLALLHRAFASFVQDKPATKRALYDAIDAYFEKQMQRLRVPGSSLAIVEGDRIVHLRGFGQSRPGGEAPMPKTPFFIGSLTKSITALAVMQLVEAGKVELDAPVQRYLPWFRVADHQASAQMTVRHLLNQTSGLPVVPGLVSLADFNSSADATECQVRALSSLKISRPVGAKCEYSNLNYNILGLIIEAASGEKYTDYIQNHIFDPLEMKHSFTTKAAAKQHGLAMGHRHWFSLPFPAPDIPVPRGSLPSGQLISCAEDMAHYLIAHLNGGRFGEVQILSEEGIEELHRGAADFVMGGISSGRYGMGWVEMDIGETRTFSHGGNVPEYSGSMALIPEQKKGVVLLLNADPYGLPPILEEVGMGVTALLAGEQPAPIKLNFIQWIMRLLPLIPLLQGVGVLATLGLVRRWRQNPPAPQSRVRMYGRHVLLPLLPNLVLTSALGNLRNSGLLRYLQVYNPDLSWIVRISGGFASVWVCLRTSLVLRTLRKISKSFPVTGSRGTGKS